jgi:hypothetical protein
MMSGQRKSFHALRKLNTARVTRIGVSAGSTIVAKVRSSLAPSIRAASSSSSGMESAYWRTRNMPNTLASDGTRTPAYVLTSPRYFSNRNSGIMPTCPGMISAPSRPLNTRSRPRKGSLAKAYPAVTLKLSESSVASVAMRTLLKMRRPMPACVNICR